MKFQENNLTYMQPQDRQDEDKFEDNLSIHPDATKGGTLKYIKGRVGFDLAKNISAGDVYSQTDELFTEVGEDVPTVDLAKDIKVIEVNGAASVWYEICTK